MQAVTYWGHLWDSVHLSAYNVILNGVNKMSKPEVSEKEMLAGVETITEYEPHSPGMVCPGRRIKDAIRARLLAYDELQGKHDKLKAKVEEWQDLLGRCFHSELPEIAKRICDYREGE